MMRLAPALLAALAACAAPEPVLPPSGDRAAAEAACRAEARERFNDIAAVKSGQTVYVPGAEEAFFNACMRGRGYR